ncbi:MAG: hypothetical protein LBF82_00870, partial [Lactobacillales bacterium]|nr:hypothetical protein [Lactobacillales bacterium]
YRPRSKWEKRQIEYAIEHEELGIETLRRKASDFYMWRIKATAKSYIHTYIPNIGEESKEANNDPPTPWCSFKPSVHLRKINRIK